MKVLKAIGVHRKSKNSIATYRRALERLSIFLSTLMYLYTARAYAAKPPCPPPVSHISVEAGEYGSAPDITFQLHHFAATLEPLGRRAPSCYEKLTVVSHGEIFISDETMTKIFTTKLANSDSKIKDLQIQNSESGATLSGSVTKLKLIPIHFSISGPVTTDGRRIRLEVKSIKADGIPIEDLLGILGDHLSTLFHIRGVQGIVIEKNSLSFSPIQVAHLKGRITGVSTLHHGLQLRYEP